MKPNTLNNDEHDSAGYVDEWNIRDEKDVHPSHKTEVWTKEEISRLTAHWLENGIKQGYAKALNDVEKIIDKVFDKFFKNKYPQAFMTSDLQSELKQSLAKLRRKNDKKDIKRQD